MQDAQPNRRAPKSVNLFDRGAIVSAVRAKMDKKEKKPSSVALASAVWRGYTGWHDGRSGTFKKNRRKELKLSARRRQRRIGR